MQGLLCPLQPLQICAGLQLCACRCGSSAALSVQLGQIAGLQLCVHAGDAAAVQHRAVLHAGLTVALCSPCSFVQGCCSVCMQVVLQQCNKELCCMQGSLCPLQPLQLCAGLQLCVHADAAAVQRSVFSLGRLQGCSSVCMQEVMQQCNMELCCMQGSLYPLQPLQLCAGLQLCVHAGGAAAVQQGAVLHAGLAVPFAAPAALCRVAALCACR